MAKGLYSNQKDANCHVKALDVEIGIWGYISQRAEITYSIKRAGKFTQVGAEGLQRTWKAQGYETEVVPVPAPAEPKPKRVRTPEEDEAWWMSSRTMKGDRPINFPEPVTVAPDRHAVDVQPETVKPERRTGWK